jgi:hypothetical protein
MALETKISYDLAAALLDNAINTLLTAGAGDAIINIYDDTGTVPVDCSADNNTNLLLGTCKMAVTPFVAAADESPGAMIDENGIADDTSADNDGTARYFRVYDTTDGTDAGKTNCILQGSAGVAGDTTDLTLDDKEIVTGGTISVTDYKIRMPEA